MAIVRILYVSTAPFEANYSGSFRNNAMLHGLLKCGCEVHTLTPKVVGVNDGQTTKHLKRLYLDNTLLIHNISKGIKANKKSVLSQLKIKLAALYNRSSIYGTSNGFVKCVGKIKGLEGYYDIIISSSDAKVAHVIAEKLIRLNPNMFGKWIQYWGDPFYIDIDNKYLFPSILVKREEERVLKLADIIVYTSPMTLFVQKKIFKDCSSKMLFLPTPYIEERIYPITKNENLIVGYYGDYKKHIRNIMPLYNVAKNLTKIKFEFIGNSDENLEGEDNIFLKERICYEELMIHEAKCDILVCLGNRQGCTQLPGKLYQYSATNKPILFIYEKFSNDILGVFNKYDRFYMCENDENEIKNTIKKMISERNREYKPVTDFKSEKIAEKLLDYYQKDDKVAYE